MCIPCTSAPTGLVVSVRRLASLPPPILSPELQTQSKFRAASRRRCFQIAMFAPSGYDAVTSYSAP